VKTCEGGLETTLAA